MRAALRFLASVGLIHLERSRRGGGDQTANAYRLAYLDSYNHPGASTPGETPALT